MKFAKPPFTFEQTIELLKGRGLSIQDEDRAKFYLQNIGYYRLFAYSIPFQTSRVEGSDHQFLEGADFESILQLYIFDRQLRLIVLDALERIEVAIRTHLTNSISLVHTAHWYLNADLFYDPLKAAEFLTKVSHDTNSKQKGRNKGEAVQHYYKTYTDPVLPPSWVVLEELSIGAISRLYNSLRNDVKNEVNTYFCVPPRVMESWLRGLTVLRNKCAHHARIWNASYPPITIPKKGPEIGIISPNKIQGLLAVITHMMKQISGDTEWEARLVKHLDTCPVKFEVPMGYVKTNLK